MKKIAVIGVGNILMKDEGVGVHSLKKLETLKLPNNVELYEGGTRILDILPSLEGVDLIIIIDAVKSSKKPGTVNLFEVELSKNGNSKEIISLHEMDLISSIKFAKQIYDLPGKIIIIGIEPKEVDVGIEMTEEVTEAIPEVIEKVHKTIQCHSSSAH
jgi:hydrogenase maturation protease